MTTATETPDSERGISVSEPPPADSRAIAGGEAPPRESYREHKKWVAHGLSAPWMYRSIAWGCVTLPLPMLRLISIVGNTIGMAFLRETVAGIADNYRLAFGLPPREARRMARRLFYSYGRNVVDLFRTRSGRPELLPRTTTFDLDARVLGGLRDTGRGFLIVCGHVGNWELGAVPLRTHRVNCAVMGQPEIDPDVHAIRLAVRRKLGVETIETGASMTTALRVRDAIARGVAVAVVVDRAYENDRILVPFFGRPTPFLRSPATLARFCQCPILPAFFLRNEDGTYRSLFGEVLHADPSLDPDEDALRIMTSIAGVAERALREEPLQWFNFYRYWGEDS